MKEILQFSLVTTTYNEINRIGYTIEDIENQVMRPTEIVITDAGSTDGTYERLLAWSNESKIDIKILLKPKCNVAQGRNFAIDAASFPIIASTDFGCRFHKNWLKSIIEPFEDSDINVVGGGYTVIEEDIQTLPARANYVLSAGYTSVMDDYFIPSSRSIAYYKKVWENVGGYAEWLSLAADDLVFGKTLKSKGYRFYLVEKPYVYWGRHLETQGYAREAFRYGLGDGEARVNQRQFIRGSIETLFRYLFLFSVTVGSLLIHSKKLPLFCIIFLFPLAIGFKPYFYGIKNWIKFKSKKYSIKVCLFSFYLIEISRLNYTRGYSKGYFFSSELIKAKARELRLILKS
ncbi:MAG TPA: glycosyltransferase, partial [Cytophagaceae bacterium]